MNWADRGSPLRPASANTRSARLPNHEQVFPSRKVEQMFAMTHLPWYVPLEHVFASEGTWDG